MTDPRKELKFQDHIIDSYKMAGGHARKWATDLQVGMPDLICSLLGYGCHLVEVKHRPSWKVGITYANPLTEKQKFECGKYKMAGAKVHGFVIVGGSDALGSQLALFDPTEPHVPLLQHVPYVAGKKFNVAKLLGVLE